MPTPFFGQVFTFTQPDGSPIQLRGWGNQHYAVFETLDGYTVTRNPATGYYEVAQLSPDGDALQPAPVPGVARSTARRRACRPACACGAKGPWPRVARRRCAWRAGAASSGARSGASRCARCARGRGRRPAAGAAAAPDGGRLRRPVPADRLHRRAGDDCARRGRALLQPAGLHRLRQPRLGARLLSRQFDRPLPLHATSSRRTTARTQPKTYYTDRSIRQPQRAVELINEALAHHKANGFDFSPLTADNQGFVVRDERLLRRAGDQQLGRGPVAALLTTWAARCRWRRAGRPSTTSSPRWAPS